MNGVSSCPIVKAAARKHLDAGAAVVVVVGDGSAPMVQRTAGRDEPLIGADGKQMTLRQALTKLADDGTFGKGGLLVLDADGQPLP